jgi:hypothetical protein
VPTPYLAVTMSHQDNSITREGHAWKSCLPGFIYYSRMNFLRFLMLLALADWVGALIFFPVVAQISFSVLPSAQLAGMVVRNSLRQLHWMGFISGVVFIAASLAYSRMMTGTVRAFRFSHVLVILMLALTAISQFRIIPRMDAIRAVAREIASIPADSPLRTQFNSLHVWSTRIEETVLVLGLVVLYLTSRRLVRSSA